MPLSVPLYTAAAAGRLRWSVAVAGFYIAAAVVVVGARQHDLAGLLVVVPEDAALLVVVILLGEVVRSRRVRLAVLADRMAQLEVQREQEAARRVAEERLHVAREVHDIVGHSVSVISVHAGLAEDLLVDDPGRARESLAIVRIAAREAMTELKATVSLLRTGESGGPRAPHRGLADLDALLALVREPDFDVQTRIVGQPRPLPGVVDLSAYRVVQESLTNVARHAAATRADITINYRADDVLIEIADDGRGPAPGARSGNGISGMTERVEALGGTIMTGTSATGGFVVRARLPLDPTRVAGGLGPEPEPIGTDGR